MGESSGGRSGRRVLTRAHLTLTIGAALSAVMLASCSTVHPSPAREHRSTASPVSRAAARYLAIAEVGNDGLERDFDGLDGPDHSDLDAARADLRDAASVERRFDRSLRAIPLPAPIDAVATALIRANESRAVLTNRAAVSTSIPQLRRYQQRLLAANRGVEDEVTAIRMLLHLPPLDES